MCSCIYVNHHQVTPTLMSIQRLYLHRLECRTGLFFRKQQESRPWRNLTKFYNYILQPSKVTAYPSQTVKYSAFPKFQPSVKAGKQFKPPLNWHCYYFPGQRFRNHISKTARKPHNGFLLHCKKTQFYSRPQNFKFFWCKAY